MSRLKTAPVFVGTVLLAIVGYLSAGDKLSDLSREWASVVRESAIGTALMIPSVRNSIAKKFVDENFGNTPCISAVDQFDLDKGGWENDLVVAIGSKKIDPECSYGAIPSLAILRNVGWSWYAVDLLKAEISQSQFQVKEGYIFLSLSGSNFPSFVIFALSGDGIDIIHQDYGELPEDLSEMFQYAERHKFLVSGRDQEVVISFDDVRKKHIIRKVSRDRSEFSHLHVLGSSSGGWTEGYVYDGGVIKPEEGTFSTQFGDLDLVFIPDHCDTKGLARAPAFPGYFRAKSNAEEIRVCCPIDVEEYGVCHQEVNRPTDLEDLVIDIE